MKNTLATPADTTAVLDSVGVGVVALAVFAIVVLAQLPLVLNPGYFSHDELQWAAIGAQGGAFDWGAIQTFQYRPLTFTLWSQLSRALFDQPQAFHAVIVAWGALNAALLAVFGRRLGMWMPAALFGALAFALGPYAMYVHGWVGTLGDLLWMTCALVIGIVVARSEDRIAIVAMSLLLTVVALLAKEAAVSIPALLALMWWFSGRQRRWGLATVASAIPVAIYLMLRIGVLLFAPREAEGYVWSIGHVPLRWSEYQLFVPNIAVFEAGNALSRGIGDKRVLLSAALWLALSIVLARVGWRWLAAFLLGGLAALAPVLVLGASTNHYGYGFAALTALVVAAVWSRAGRGGRAVIAVLAILNLWHGVNVMRGMRHVGEVQSVFSPALANAVRESGQPVLRLLPATAGDAWIFERLTHEISSYQGIVIGQRVQLVQPDTAADYRIETDGRLTLLR
ncbi:MAG: hypothetical protein LH470_07305 [Lysobacter sp.]|nr:hypothetical protein [Lysobacter sp.]